MVYCVYKILADDTLESIASRLNCTCDELIRLNGIDESEFVSDTYIVIPKDDSLYFYYTVQSGDTLYGLSNKFDVDLNTLYAINGLDDGDYIYPNQELLIPNNGISMYFTKDGDTLNDLLDFFDEDAFSIIQNNPNIYLVSDQLIVYKRD